MARVGQKESIRKALITAIGEGKATVSADIALGLGISRQAVHHHLKSLQQERIVTATGHTRARKYELLPLVRKTFDCRLQGLEEHRVWQGSVRPLLGELPANVLDIWHYGFTEMVNNAIDHSEGTMVGVQIMRDAYKTEMTILDDGVGIFRKIKEACGLEDERHAVLELAKGKLTTDPAHHTGEGIFFSSRAFDDYAILSGKVHFSHRIKDDRDWIVEAEAAERGTVVVMALRNHSSKKMREVHDQFSSGDEYSFNKTIVPVRLLKVGAENLVSRSQAKRLLVRFERFKTVLLDFSDIDEIGQAFADEVFRVFPSKTPATEIVPINANRRVKQMIERAKHQGVLL